MEQGLIKVNKKLFALLLICLVVFLIFPKISLAGDFENITKEEIEKYLPLPSDKVESLIRSLIDLFNSEWINQISSAYSTAEESAVPNIMRSAVRVQALNHLLIDAPVEVAWKIINNTVKIARLVGTQDISVILNELEKESVQRAVEYGMNFLFQNEIRVTPGAIGFRYLTQKGETKEAIFQYVMIYHPIEAKRGKLVIRFYSPSYLEIPKNQGNITGTVGFYTELTHNLPPFIVDIQGVVADYQWVGSPSIKIDFPPEVPDLGIKPLTFWEKYVLKPIESRIKEVEVIITKITGGSSNIVEAILKIPQIVEKGWDAITSTIKALAQWGGAQVGSLFNNQSSVEPEGPPEPLASPQPQTTEQQQEATSQSQQLTLEELQEMLDDIAERMDILSQKFAELIEAKKQQTETEEIKEDEEDEEEDEDLEKKEAGVCSVNINTASKEGLQKITGVGPTIAQRIIEARPFYSIYELTKVSGIGEVTLQKIISQGCAHVVGDTGPGSAASMAATYPKILISEVQIWDTTSNDHDFIELYNPGPKSEDISGFQLKKRSSTGSESSVSLFPAGSLIQAKGYFFWANSNYASSTGLEADVVTTQTLAQDNSLALLDPDKNVIDAAAWGSSTNPFIEGFPFPQSPEKGKSLGRKWSTTTENYLDTDNNQNDFEIQTPTPKAQNQNPVPQPPAPPLTVVINEIAWMGTATSSNDEWIELHNTTKNEIDLTGWKLVSITDGSPDITLSGTISPLGFYLLERTNDDPVKDILADWKGSFGSGGLKDTGEELELRDGNGNLIDKVGCQKDSQNNCISWFAGKKEERISMERINPRVAGEDSANWANNNTVIRNGLDANGDPINGTPKAQNSAYQSLPPESVSDLTIDETQSRDNIVFLTWSAPNDPDTLPENLSYEIYYLKESLNEDNLEQASVASTTAATTSISDLDYNSDYYFGIKAFDGENYSELSNVVSYQIISALVNSPWLAFRKNLQRSGQSDFLGPQTEPTVIWIYNEEVDLNDSDRNPLYTSPVVRAEGAIFSSVIFPTNKKGILALNPDGSKKWFQDEDIDFPLALQPDGSVLADDISRAWSEDKTAYYLGQDDTLYAFDKDGNERWQRQFEFEDPQQFGCSSATPSVLTPAVGTDETIYVVVQSNACSSQWDRVDFLYAISPENEIIWQTSLGGYNSSLPTVTVNNTIYVFNLTYGNYPVLWLKKVIYNGEIGEIQWTKNIVSNYSPGPYSLPATDNQENIYFAVGKDVFALDKNRNEIWKILLANAPSNWYSVSEIGIALDKNEILYLSGRGAIFALK